MLDGAYGERVQAGLTALLSIGRGYIRLTAAGDVIVEPLWLRPCRRSRMAGVAERICSAEN